MKFKEENTVEILEAIFKMFNINHPKDFKGKSLSVGDLVELDNTFYYCDSIGFKIIEPVNKIPTCSFDEYLAFEHGRFINDLVLMKEREGKNEKEIHSFIEDLKEDFKQFCWEEGYKAI